MAVPYAALRAEIAKLVDDAAAALGYAGVSSSDSIGFSEQFGDF